MSDEFISISRLKRARFIKERISFSPRVCDFFMSTPYGHEDDEAPCRFRIYENGEVSYLVCMDDEYHAFDIPQRKVRQLITLIKKWSIYSLPEKLLEDDMSEPQRIELVFYDHNGVRLTQIGGDNPINRKFIEVKNYIKNELITPYMPDDISYRDLPDNEELHDVIYYGLKISQSGDSTQA